jgi:hypothetical protein
MNFELATTPRRCHQCGDWIAQITWHSARGTLLSATRHLDDRDNPTAAWHNHFAKDVPRTSPPSRRQFA